VGASERTAGKPYKNAVSWKQDSPIPGAVQNLEIQPCVPGPECRVVFSGLEASVAGEVEEEFARAGCVVLSNSRNHRMDPDVPLVIPELNPDHLGLIEVQKRGRPFPGCIVTNANCSSIFLAMALGPLHRAFGIERVFVVTLQAISGAGYPGVPSLDILGNVIPYIGGEEEKMESEVLKMLGRFNGQSVESAGFTVSAQCHRVAVEDGHMEAVSVKLADKATAKEAADLLARFSGPPQELRLPSAPPFPIVVLEDSDRPQPRLDVHRAGGMATTVGRIRPCPIFDLKFSVLGHNTIRGAAGASILNAELLKALGYLD